MYTWKKSGDLPLYQSTIFDWLPDIVHGFTTRRGGVSLPPYDSLNLGAHVEDNPEDVASNRHRVYDGLGFRKSQVALAEQVHGDRVAVVTQGGLHPAEGADALITNTPNIMLMLFFADCVPVYIVDPAQRVIGLVHAGWRGTRANIVGKTIQALSDNYGTVPKTCLAAVGPCIGAESYEVGRDVADEFRNFPTGRYVGATLPVLPKNELTGTFCLDLRLIIYLQLLAAGVSSRLINICEQDTVRNRKDFFSHRRDGGATGRMGAVLGMRRDIDQ